MVVYLVSHVAGRNVVNRRISYIVYEKISNQKDIREFLARFLTRASAAERLLENFKRTMEKIAEENKAWRERIFDR